MVEMNSLVDKLFKSRKPEYSLREGNVTYLDAGSLKRPMRMPAQQRIVAIVIIVIAVVLGVFFLNSTLFESWRAAGKSAQAIEENLARPSALESLPQLSTLALASQDEVAAAIKADGYKTYDASAKSDNNSLILWRIPDDVNFDDAAMMVVSGISNVGADSATKLLNGSWVLEASRVSTASTSLHYADFSTKDTKTAIVNAVTAQKFDTTSIEESGTDESGNDFSRGSITIDGTECSWRVSAVPLSEVYKIKGMPDKACYVGIRITQK